jgi:hypothetical protein
MMFDFNKTTRLGRDQQHLYLGDEHVSGLQSFDVNFSSNETPIVHLGMSENNYANNGPKIGQVRTTSFMLGHDFFINMTGETGFNGYLIKDSQKIADNFSFESGYLTSYSQRCSVGELPQINASFTVFGRIGKLSQPDSDQIDEDLDGIENQTGPTHELKNINAGSIDISFGEEFDQDRITAYQFDIVPERQPHFVLGMEHPYRVTTKYPVQVNLSLSVELARFQPRNNYDYPCSPDTGNFNLKLKDFYNDQVIQEYNFENMRLASQSYSASAAGPPVLELQYQCLLRNPST